MLFVKEKRFYKNVYALAIPIVLQNVISLLLNFADTIMLGRLEEGAAETAISAAGFGTQPFFVFTLFIFGIMSGSSVLISQYWGKRDKDTINKIAGIAVTVGLAVSIVVTVICLTFPHQIMSLFTDSSQTRELSVRYLTVIAYSFIPFSVTTILFGVMRSSEKAKIPVIINAVAIFTNIVFNWLLIFGVGIFPRLEVRGAAIATLIARVFECVMALLYVFVFEKDLRLRVTKMFAFSKPLVSKFFKYSLPVIFNETLWGLGTTVHAAILGKLGDDVYSAYSISNIVERIGLVVVMGLANTTAIICGKAIGEGRTEAAYGYSKTLMSISVISGAVFGAVLFVLRQLIIGFFNIQPGTSDIANSLIIMVICMLLFKAFNTPMIVGVLRSGGDTVTAMLLDLLTMWCFAIPLGFIMAFAVKIPAPFVYLCLVSDEVAKMPFALKRYVSKKWIKNVTSAK